MKAEPRTDVNTTALELRLKRNLKGEVRFDVGSRALYATDGSNYRQVPIGVVIPKDAEDVQETVAACHKFGAPLLCRGGGTSLAGQCCNVAVVMDFTKYMNRVIEIDPRRKLARVQPGCVLDSLRHAAARQYGLTFGPDPRLNAANTALVQYFRSQRYEPEAYTLYTYAAIQAWAQAATIAHSTDMTKVSAALKANMFDTVKGRVGFTPKGDVTGAGYVVYVWRNGKYVTAQ